MAKYIVFQMSIIDQKIIDLNVTNVWSNIVRQVDADSMESAIGKFVVGTADVKAIQKLDIEAVLLSELKSI